MGFHPVALICFQHKNRKAAIRIIKLTRKKSSGSFSIITGYFAKAQKADAKIMKKMA